MHSLIADPRAKASPFDADALRLFACPECHAPLQADSHKECLVCERHGEFAVVDGIPLFSRIREDRFDAHWEANHLAELPLPKIEAGERFLAPLRERLAGATAEPLTILDAGCGDGVHVRILSQETPSHEEDLSRESETRADPTLVGIDISVAALRIANSRGQGDWRFVQGDVGRLPFLDERFDCVFSFGVLAYTADPATSFRELCRVARPGGLIGIWVYPKPSGLAGMALRMVRRICRIGGRFVSHRLADLIVPWLGMLPTRSGLSLRNASWGECREVVLVNIAPAQLVFPAPDEIRGWFTREGIEVVADDVNAPVTLWGVKR